LQQQQQQQHPAPAASNAIGPAAAVGRHSPPREDLRLQRPIDPTNPQYYWKPVLAADGKVKMSAGMALDSMLGAQVRQARVSCFHECLKEKAWQQVVQAQPCCQFLSSTAKSKEGALSVV
jgi:hypothetical protein